MSYRGHVRNGVVVFDGAPPLAEGTPVRVEPEPARPISGTPGKELLRFAGLIDPADLRQMSEAIEDCGRIEPDEW